MAKRPVRPRKTAAPVQIVDTHALMARLRAQDPAAIAQAYRMTFGSDLGRLVLAHHLAASGVGQIFGPDMDPVESRYRQGRHDGALDLFSRAGFDLASAALMVMTGQLEGRDDERAGQPASWADGDPEF